MKKYRHCSGRFERKSSRRWVPWEEILDAIQESLPEDAIFVRDVTVPATTWGSRLILRRYPRTTLHASGGGIGQALPMAIGAQIAAPAKTVLALCGDGGLLVNIGELAVARQENTPIVIVCFDDNGYGVLRNIQNAHFEGRRIGVDLQSPDYVTVARGFGFNSERVKSAHGVSRSCLLVQCSHANRGWLWSIPMQSVR